MTSYIPRGETAAMLDRAWGLVQSVEYQVTARWLFYRLLQEGWYSGKSDYSNKFLKAISRARHEFYKDWRPDTLADDTRQPVIRGAGYRTVPDWIEAIQRGVRCDLDRWAAQSHYVELWFEADGMRGQFDYYTDHITLRPMKGQPSIDYKWQCAKALEAAAGQYGKPVVILYFGDLDQGGERIAEAVERDVRKWCNADFSFYPCGLTLDQVQRYGVPENIERPGSYQWEALSDEGAREIILSSIGRFVRHDALSARDAEAKEAEQWLRRELVGLADRWQG